MNRIRISLILSILLTLLVAKPAYAGFTGSDMLPAGPDALSAFSISPSPVYPGNEITFYIEWTGATGLSVGEGHALCIYYSNNFNNSIGLTTDGFTAATDVSSFGGDYYIKEGPSSLGGSTSNCPSSVNKSVVGYVVTEASGGILNTEDILQITIIVPREAASETFILRQRHDPVGPQGWVNIGLRTSGETITPAANTVYAGTSVQCGANNPCYSTVQGAVNYVANGGTVNVMGPFVENVATHGRDMILQQGSSSASLTASGNSAISITGGTVVIRDLSIQANSPAPAINLTGGNVIVKGTNINADNGTVFGCGGGTLSAYANNFSNVVTAASGSACTAHLEHNFWGVYDGSGPGGLDPAAWAARLGNLVESYSDAIFTVPGSSVNLGGASLGGGTGTAVIVSHGKNYPPFGNGIAKYIYSMCGEYYDFFVRGGGGTWNIILPVDNNTACNTNVLAQHAVFTINNIADCALYSNPDCWDPVTVGVSVNGQALQVSGITTANLAGTQYVVGSSDGTDPTAIQLRSLTASSARNGSLPILLLILALVLGSGGLILARKRV